MLFCNRAEREIMGPQPIRLAARLWEAVVLLTSARGKKQVLEELTC